MSAPTAAASARIETTSDLGVFGTIAEGVRLSPAMKKGIGITAAIAIVATIGRLVVPTAVQQVTDHGLLAPGGVNVTVVWQTALIAAGVLLLTSSAAALANIRLFIATEAGLAQLRNRAFAHIHHLSVLTQNTERRGALVSRVTTDVDTISRFVQWGGMQLIMSSLQLLGATVAMAIYSWKLTTIVWLVFVPMLVLAPKAQAALNRRFSTVRVKAGVMLAAISEAVVGAQTIRAYGVGTRTRNRIDGSIEDYRSTEVRAQVLASLSFSTGTLLSGVALGVAVIAGTLLGVDEQITVGELLAFLFLLQIFTGPVQTATEVLNDLQSAVAGWRRVISIIHTPLDITEPERPVDAGDRGAAAITFEDVRYAYPGGPEVLKGVTFDIPAGAKVAIVGETGSGKTTLARLLTRFADPHHGRVLLDGVDLRDLALADLRSRIVIVPQEGFLFTGTIAYNITYARPDLPDPAAAAREALADLGLTNWVAGLPAGVDTEVGQRGEALSAGERQLVALARAYLADADLLVLDEATSAVDPATEARINRALAALTEGKTAVSIAHRLSTAEAADLIAVIDHGELAELGHHSDLAAAGGIYARMQESWTAQLTRSPESRTREANDEE